MIKNIIKIALVFSLCASFSHAENYVNQTEKIDSLETQIKWIEGKITTKELVDRLSESCDTTLGSLNFLRGLMVPVETYAYYKVKIIEEDGSLSKKEKTKATIDFLIEYSDKIQEEYGLALIGSLFPWEDAIDAGYKRYKIKNILPFKHAYSIFRDGLYAVPQYSGRMDYVESIPYKKEMNGDWFSPVFHCKSVRESRGRSGDKPSYFVVEYTHTGGSARIAVDYDAFQATDSCRSGHLSKRRCPAPSKWKQAKIDKLIKKKDLAFSASNQSMPVTSEDMYEQKGIYEKLVSDRKSAEKARVKRASNKRESENNQKSKINKVNISKHYLNNPPGSQVVLLKGGYNSRRILTQSNVIEAVYKWTIRSEASHSYTPPVKGEFETTDEYNSKIAKEEEELASLFEGKKSTLTDALSKEFNSWAKLKTANVKYDADNRVFNLDVMQDYSGDAEPYGPESIMAFEILASLVVDGSTGDPRNMKQLLIASIPTISYLLVSNGPKKTLNFNTVSLISNPESKSSSDWLNFETVEADGDGFDISNDAVGDYAHNNSLTIPSVYKDKHLARVREELIKKEEQERAFAEIAAKRKVEEGKKRAEQIKQHAEETKRLKRIEKERVSSISENYNCSDAVKLKMGQAQYFCIEPYYGYNDRSANAFLALMRNNQLNHISANENSEGQCMLTIGASGIFQGSSFSDKISCDITQYLPSILGK